MSEAQREYPRQWFSSSRWSDGVTAKVFVSESEHRLRLPDCDSGRKRYESKCNGRGNQVWFPTREAADAAVAKRQAEKANADALRRMREAAPELLEALEGLLPDRLGYGNSFDHEAYAEAVAVARAALSKAKGEA